MKPSTRRNFLATSAAGAAGFATASLAGSARADHHEAAADHAAAPAITLKQGATVLLQGDSITDAGRSRETQGTANDFAMLGNGYAKLIAYHLLSRYPDKNLQIYNRGISGHRVPDLQNRWQQDCIDLAPDVVSILIGVNDIWRTFDRGSTATAQDYRRQLTELLATTRQALPDAQLVVCEPFVLRCGHITDAWFPEFDNRRQVAKDVADHAGAVLVSFQTMFDAAVQAGSAPEFWAKDGVHPSAQGSALMAMRWLGETGLA